MKFTPFLAAAALAAAPAHAQDEPAPDPKEAFVPATIDAHQRAIVSGLNRFGLDLYGKLSVGSGDMAFSPASASAAFALAYAGARGRTAEEIAAVLHYPDVPDFHASFGGLLKTMELRRNGRTVSINNAIWLQEGLRVQPAYRALVERHYGAGLQRVDYRGNPGAALGAINRWVEARTNNRIRNLLGPADVTEKTRSVLVNTVYLKADWAEPFDKAATRERPFTLASGALVQRPSMERKLDAAYAEAPGVKAVALPYRGGELEMMIFLPDSASGLPAFERSLTAEQLDSWVERLSASRDEVLVTLPKFRLESRFELNDPLQELGMRIPFSNASDFSGLKVVDPGSSDQEDWNLKIDKVVQQVFVEVEEKGTEAAAATAIMGVIVTGARVGEPKVFKADHPFLFMIRDRRTGAMLFVGRYSGGSA